MNKSLTIGLTGILVCISGFGFYGTLAHKLEYIPEDQLRHQRKIKRIPEDMTFAGEKVHFKSPDAYLRYYRELKVNTQSNSSTRLLFRNVRIWLPEITRIVQAYNLHDDFKYLAVAESNLSNSISPKGAAGFWQLTVPTALELGLVVNEEVDERYHPFRATKAACRFFKKSYKIFGNWTSVAASYNRGVGGLQRAFNNQSVNSYYDLALNDETSRYLYRILAIKDLLNHPAKYGITVLRKQRPKMKLVRVDSTITNLDKFARLHKTDLVTLKEFNPWILGNKLTVSNKKMSFEIIIPLEATRIALKPQIDSNKMLIPEKDVDKLSNIMNGASIGEFEPDAFKNSY
ncbi:lytic transglycosylase domain-containing protein [Sporocytophaga myxococcoides]|uniref:lytic transglycosylase domain-containing protein n=1 Tax=Sporocytophaga myxococcoides TaxID=153721 RepID=UPI0004207E9C|nr:lytic transglycosylase domain-containing protein [Sporocytophaga myxococcoides]